MSGTLDIIVGPMFSGKSTELLRRLTVKATIKKNNVLYINHSFDNRNPDGSFSTHNPLLKQKTSDNSNITFINANKIGEILDYILLNKPSFNIIGIDEAQFFEDLYLIKDIVELNGIHIIIAGLNSDYNRVPFEPIHNLIPFCDTMTKLKACCMSCAENGQEMDALFTHRIKTVENKGDTERIIIGSTQFIPVCRKCYLQLNR